MEQEDRRDGPDGQRPDQVDTLVERRQLDDDAECVRIGLDRVEGG